MFDNKRMKEHLHSTLAEIKAHEGAHEQRNELLPAHCALQNDYTPSRRRIKYHTVDKGETARGRRIQRV